MKPTRQRAAIADLLSGGNEFRSAQEIYNQLRTDGESVGLATVYRTLQSMATNGDVDVLVREDGESVYRRCGEGHHHHLVCKVCGKTVEISGPTVEAWADGMAARHGFRDISHTLELSGVCSDC